MNRDTKPKGGGIHPLLIVAIVLVALLITTYIVMSILYPNQTALLKYIRYRLPGLTGLAGEEITPNPNNELSYLTVNDTEIRDEDGNTVVLQGVNLGGWFLQEYWMCPVKGLDEVEQWTHLETLDTLTARFGEEQARELLYTYEENWITEWDIQNIASMGYNVIRVPFGYWEFMSDAEGTWLTENPDDNHGFRMLDWVIDTARQYGLYVVLDMHGCPGGQSTQHVAGSARHSELYRNEANQAAMESLWVAIAERYKGNATVAMYDIMNEPTMTSQATYDARPEVYDRMYKAIRAVDPDHIIAIEGIWDLSVLPDPGEQGWTNVVYEVHPYDARNAAEACQELATYRAVHNVPVYIGEFSDRSIVTSADQYGISYTSWTYKGTNNANGTWFMYYKTNLAQADVSYDSYKEIQIKWGKALQTQYFKRSSWVR